MTDDTSIDLRAAEAGLRRRNAAPLRHSPLARRDFDTVMACSIEIDPEPEFLVHGLLTAGGLSAVWGEPGCGKSFLALDLALSVATGRRFLGRDVQAGGVVYVAAEGGRGFKKRVVAYRQRHGIPDDASFALIPANVDLCTEHHETDALIEEIQLLVELQLLEEIRLVVIDTLARAMSGGNENDSLDMGRLIKNADRIREATGANVMFVHHSGKDKDRKTRGHSSFYGALDTGIEVAVSEATGARRAVLMKQKDSEDGIELHFRLDVVTVAYGGDGAGITSCVIEAAEPESAAREDQDRTRRLTGVTALVLDALRKAVADHGAAPPACEHIPPGVKAVSPELWRKYFYQTRTTESPDANRVAFKRAVTELQNRQIVGCWGDFAWPA
jgi:hypothetical protein